jgi:hypothetical protein
VRTVSSRGCVNDRSGFYDRTSFHSFYKAAGLAVGRNRIRFYDISRLDSIPDLDRVIGVPEVALGPSRTRNQPSNSKPGVQATITPKAKACNAVIARPALRHLRA